MTRLNTSGLIHYLWVSKGGAVNPATRKMEGERVATCPKCSQGKRATVAR